MSNVVNPKSFPKKPPIVKLQAFAPTPPGSCLMDVGEKGCNRSTR
jgi:hypothetical protein